MRRARCVACPALRRVRRTQARVRIGARVLASFANGQPFLLVRTTYTNTFDKAITVALEDDLRMDNVPDRSKKGITRKSQKQMQSKLNLL